MNVAIELSLHGSPAADSDEHVRDSQSCHLEHFLASVERRALRMAEIATGQRDDALDIVQDAMYKLVQRYGKRPPTEWGPLFQRILQNRIHDWYRRRILRNRLQHWLHWDRDDDDGIADPLENLPDLQGHAPEQSLQGEQAMQELERALRDLPLRQQQVFLLRVWEGYDVAQTARAMGCSQGSVKTHYSRAIHKLQERLGDFRP